MKLGLVGAATLALALAPQDACSARIRHDVHRALQTNDVADVVIVFKQSTSESLESFSDAPNPKLPRSERINRLMSHLEDANNDIQREVLDLAATKGTCESTDESKPMVQAIHRFAVTSNLYVDGATSEFIQSVAQLPNVEEIRAPEVVPSDKQMKASDEKKVAQLETFGPLPTVQWGVQKVSAPDVWKMGFTGQNVLVGHIDSGVRGTHEALKSSFIGGEFGWFDPVKNATEPYDSDFNSHGTHSLGIIVGSGGIGVAPGAKWMACRGCNNGGGCYEKNLMACFDFMTCPTNASGRKDCSKAPRVINNSWGGNNVHSLTYKEVVAAWRAAGIIPVFSIGNDRPECGTVGSPGNLETVIGVGAATETDGISRISNKGPNVRGKLKPDLVAPGENIYSSLSGSDTGYGVRWGTSTAAPHVTGAVVLLLSARPDLNFDDVLKLLQTTADTQTLKGDGRNCGNISDDVFPNNAFGHGRLNAFAAIFGPSPPDSATPAL